MGISKDIARGCYRAIAEEYEAEGKFYFEMWIRNWNSKCWCDMVIHLIEPELYNVDELLVGVEVKDWKDPVPKSVVLDEYEGYKNAFDVFYFAANEYGPSVDDIDNDHIGLIDIGDDFELRETPVRQPTYRHRIQKTLKRVEKNWRGNLDELREDYPKLVHRVTGSDDAPAKAGAAHNLDLGDYGGGVDDV